MVSSGQLWQQKVQKAESLATYGHRFKEYLSALAIIYDISSNNPHHLGYLMQHSRIRGEKNLTHSTLLWLFCLERRWGLFPGCT